MHTFLFLFMSLALPHMTESQHPVRPAIAVLDSIQQQDSLAASTPLLIPFSGEIDSAARDAQLPAALLAAVIQEESLFDQWASRVEPGYLRNARVLRAARAWTALHHGNPNTLTEVDDRSRSYGLMQIMGETAREQGFSGRYLAELYLPHNSIEQGAKLLRRMLDRYQPDTLAAISAYNQGNARKSRGTFENVRYVYRVAVAWRAYEKLFRREE